MTVDIGNDLGVVGYGAHDGSGVGAGTGSQRQISRALVYLPFTMILLGISMGGLGMFGVYPVMFGYGFHF